MSKDSQSSQKIFMKFEHTLKQVKDSLNTSPINFTRREPNKVNNILMEKSQASEAYTPHGSIFKGVNHGHTASVEGPSRADNMRMPQFMGIDNAKTL